MHEVHQDVDLGSEVVPVGLEDVVCEVDGALGLAADLLHKLLVLLLDVLDLAAGSDGQALR